MSSLRFSWIAALVAAGFVGSCGASAKVYRLNPGVDPERYRLVCPHSFALCEAEAKRTCGDELVIVSRSANKPEQKDVQSTGVSATGPSQGVIGWRGEMEIVCGHDQPPIRLVRPDSAVASNTGAGQAAPVSAESPKRVCVPGATQACLGPGACAGAQACNDAGSSYGPCDCGAGDKGNAGAPGDNPAPPVAPAGTSGRSPLAPSTPGIDPNTPLPGAPPPATPL